MPNACCEYHRAAARSESWTALDCTGWACHEVRWPELQEAWLHVLICATPQRLCIHAWKHNREQLSGLTLDTLGKPTSGLIRIQELA